MNNEEAIKIIADYDVNGCGYCHQGGDEIPEAFDKAIEALRNARPKGHWEFKKIGVSTFAIVCSECGNVLHKGQNYNNLDSFKQHIQSMLDDKGISIDKFCYECGADMREDGVDATEN